MSGTTAGWSFSTVVTVLGNGSAVCSTLLSSKWGYLSCSIPRWIWVCFDRTDSGWWSTWISVFVDRSDPSLRCHDSLAVNLPSVYIFPPVAVLHALALWSCVPDRYVAYVDNGMALISAPVSGRNFTSCRPPLPLTSAVMSTSSLASTAAILVGGGMVGYRPAVIFWSLFPDRQTLLKCPDFPHPVHVFPSGSRRLTSGRRTCPRSG